jgi:hypothetical protein
MGDGWMMLSEPPGPKAVAEFDKLRRLVEAEGRDPASVGRSLDLVLPHLRMLLSLDGYSVGGRTA